MVIIVARALREPDGRAYGVIASPVQIDTLTDFIRIAALREQPLVTLIDTSGVIAARSSQPEAYVGRSVFVTGGRGALPGATQVDVIPGSDGVPRLTASVMARHAPWIINVGVPLAALEAPVRAQLATNLQVSLAALLVAALGALVLGGQLLRPLTTLADDARRIAEGDTSHRATVRGASEVVMLGSALNRMAEATEQRNASLADNERRYRFLFESNPLPMWAWNADTMEILAVNDATVEHYGYPREQLIGHPITVLLDPSELERFGERRLPFTEDRQNAGVWRHRAADGRVMEMEIITTSTRRLGGANWLSIGLDITARRAAERALAASEEQLRQSQKMEAVGAFAGGIAHDFNNLLTGIVGFTELSLGQLPVSHPVHADLREIQSLAERGAELTQRILAVSRKQVLQPTVLDLSTVVGELGRLFGRLVGEDVQLVMQLDPTVRPVRADPGQLEQVLLNLVANARDAMPSGGTLSIETRALAAADAPALALEPREWSLLLVRDTGVGMTDTVRARIFEPFFTTKERGKGTGLGLALAYAMLQQAGGTITCDSAPGEGTTFRLCFPVTEAPIDPVRHDSTVEPAPLGGRETVLVAEDEESVRTVITAALERAGYRVLVGADGPEALARAAEHDAPIDLLLTDVVMPGMHGRELAERLTAQRPGLRVLFASGYTDDAVLLRGIRVDEVPFLQKPFTPSQLVQRVRDVLDAPVVPVPPEG
jgi:PAS domain S-box-containing protein